MKNKIIYFTISAFLILGVQLFYYERVYDLNLSDTRKTDLILIYSGADDRTSVCLEFGRKSPQTKFLFSGCDYSEGQIIISTNLNKSSFLLENKAHTTDQNARYCAKIIKENNFHTIMLALPWYQMPRALFLTRLYLIGTNVLIVPFKTTQVPIGWWKTTVFCSEYIKFWGSSGRVILAAFNIENWPKRVPYL